MAKQFYIRRRGTVIGPKLSGEVKSLVTSGRVGLDDELGPDENGPWRRVEAFDTLRQLANQHLPPVSTERSPADVKTDEQSIFDPIGTHREPVLSEVEDRQPVRPPPRNPPPPATPPPPPPTPTEHLVSPADGHDPSGSSQPNDSVARHRTRRRKRNRNTVGDHALAVSAFAKNVAVKGKQVVDNVIVEGRDRVSNAYAEATRRVDESETLILRDTLILGRGGDKVDKVLPHPQISLRHAQVTRTAEGVTVTDLDSDSGTFVDGERVIGRQMLKPGSTISIGPYSLLHDGENLISETSIDNAELLCRNLTKMVPDRRTGKQRCILDRVTIAARPREFLVILGPSGSGKSTLLSALSARSLASSGDVVLNGQNLYANFDSLKMSIAVIPQQDILHEQLQLQNALLFTARLRLPPDLRAIEFERIVDEHLAAVDLSEQATTNIGNLSGGQLKRASVANEIMSEPSLLFVDEATSGLDEHTDGEIMQIFRRIAEEGKTVVCITHNLTNVEKFCHKVAILAPGGFLAFVGSASEARSYFGIESLGEIYSRLKDQTGEQWRDAFEKSAGCQQMYDEVDGVIGNDRPSVSRRARPSRLQHVGNFARQCNVLFRRGIQLMLADKRSLALMAGQCCFVATLIALLFGDASASGGLASGQTQTEVTAILFLLSVSSFWFGCNNSAKELVKEQIIYERERSVSLNIFSYYTSKFVLLAGLTLVQIIILYCMVDYLTELPGPSIAYYTSLALSGVCGVSLGLFISALASNTDMASTAVPIAVIPQVILSGMLSQVSGIAKWIACLLITTFWGFGSLVASIPDDVMVFRRPESVAEESYLFGLAVMMIHNACFVALALIVLYARDKRWKFSTAELISWRDQSR